MFYFFMILQLIIPIILFFTVLYIANERFYFNMPSLIMVILISFSSKNSWTYLTFVWFMSSMYSYMSFKISFIICSMIAILGFSIFVSIIIFTDKFFFPRFFIFLRHSLRNQIICLFIYHNILTIYIHYIFNLL